MNLHRLLQQRSAAGKFGTMFLAQARRTPGLHAAALADLDPRRAGDGPARVRLEMEALYAAARFSGKLQNTTSFKKL